MPKTDITIELTEAQARHLYNLLLRVPPSTLTKTIMEMREDLRKALDE